MGSPESPVGVKKVTGIEALAAAFISVLPSPDASVADAKVDAEAGTNAVAVAAVGGGSDVGSGA